MKVSKKKSFAFGLIISFMILAFGFIGYIQANPQIASADNQTAISSNDSIYAQTIAENTIEEYTPGLIFVATETGYTLKSVGSALDNGNTVVVIPETYNGMPVMGISHYAFRDCTTLTSVTIPANVTMIGVMAFLRCYNLTTVSFAAGSKLTHLYTASFDGCSSLVNINLPGSVTYIESHSFDGCSGISSITVPAGVTWVGLAAFSRWTSSQTIYVKGPSSMANSWENGWNAGCNAQIIWGA